MVGVEEEVDSKTLLANATGDSGAFSSTEEGPTQDLLAEEKHEAENRKPANGEDDGTKAVVTTAQANVFKNVFLKTFLKTFKF